MISRDKFDAVVATYDKYGWVLRRVVLRDLSDAPLGLAQDVRTARSVVDAAWFSRPQQSGENAWEIRFLGPTQYALVEHLDENSPDFEDKLHKTEQRLADAVAKK